MIEFIRNRPHVSTASILENWRDTRFASRLQELASEEELVNDIGDMQDAFQKTIDLLIKANSNEFEQMKSIQSPSELSEEQKTRLRSLQKSDI